MIGIYDSGLGGLTVMQAIQRALPYESLIYLADTKHFPYGSKTEEELYSIAVKALTFLSQFPLKAVVIACNTLSSSVVTPLRKRFPELSLFEVITPLINTLSTPPQKLALLATPATIRSKIYPTLLAQRFSHAPLIEIAAPRLASLIEEKEDATAHLQELLLPLFDQKIDTLILGCTHYPLIKAQIAALLQPSSCRLIDNAESSANALNAFLIEKAQLSSTTTPSHRFFASHLPHLFEKKSSAIFPHLVTTSVEQADL